MREKITVFGSCAVDLMSRAPHLPVPGETVKGSRFVQGPGGKGFNQAIAAHKAGGDVTMITKLGRDALSQVPLGVMDSLGMPKDFLFYDDEASTGVALIMVDENSSQNQIVIVPGACCTINDEDIAKAAPQIRASRYVLLQLEINQDANEKAARLAKESGCRVVINTAPCQPVSGDFLQGAYLVTPNEVEARELTGIEVTDLQSADRAAQVLFDRGVENVLITLGSRGVYLNTGGRSEILPAYRVDAVDTTGAGDAFNGGLLAALAALSVQRVGAAASMPTRAEIDGFLSEH